MFDVTGKDLSGLKAKRLFIFDMDGTIYTDGRLFPGALDLMKRIREIDGDYVFFTNNSSRSVETYIDRVKQLGIDAGALNFCTSVDAVISYLEQKHPGELTYCVGTKSLVDGLESKGIRVTTACADEATVVLLGYDTELTYSKLRGICEMLTRDVTYLATNMDLACPASFGFVPDCGAIAEMVFLATGRRPKFLGKPSPYMVEESIRRFGCTEAETVVVGDRLYTDIAAGVNASIDTICVLTGEATMEEIDAGTIEPTYVVNSVADVLDVLLA